MAVARGRMQADGMKRLFLLALFTTVASAVEFSEERVVITPASGESGAAGEAVTGAWLQPKANWDGRAVLMLHGFADDMDGPADIVKRLAERLAAEGIASLRINFRGEGDKKRTLIESTFALRLADTAAAQAWLLGREGGARGHARLQPWRDDGDRDRRQ
jgi:uncharacterized protein